MLKPYYFTHGIVSCFVGFPRVGRVKDGFARYLLYQIDFTIATTGLVALDDHWLGEGHQSLEVRYILKNGWALYNRACKEATAAERFPLGASVEGLPAVSLEPMFAVSIGEVMAHETAGETSAGKGVVSEATADRLWVCTFLDSLVVGRQFLRVGRSLETLSVTFMAELQLQQSLTDKSLCQVNMNYDFCVLII